MKKEYQLVETIDYAGKVTRKTYAKRDADKALKSLVDSRSHREYLLTVFTNEDSAYYRTLNTEYHVEIREVSDWRVTEVE